MCECLWQPSCIDRPTVNCPLCCVAGIPTSTATVKSFFSAYQRAFCWLRIVMALEVCYQSAQSFIVVVLFYSTVSSGKHLCHVAGCHLCVVFHFIYFFCVFSFCWWFACLSTFDDASAFFAVLPGVSACLDERESELMLRVNVIFLFYYLELCATCKLNY